MSLKVRKPQRNQKASTLTLSPQVNVSVTDSYILGKNMFSPNILGKNIFPQYVSAKSPSNKNPATLNLSTPQTQIDESYRHTLIIERAGLSLRDMVWLSHCRFRILGGSGDLARRK